MTEADAKAQMLDNIMAATSLLVLSKEQAIAIVGGEKHLNNLIEQGKLTFSQKGNARSSKWQFKMSEVLKFAKQKNIDNWYQKAKRKPFTAML